MNICKCFPYLSIQMLWDIDLKLCSHPRRFIDQITSNTCKYFVLILEIPVFAVITKVDKCDLSEQELENKKTEICEAIGIASNKVLMCSNYQPDQPLDTDKDISILEFMTKVLVLWFISINPPCSINETISKIKISILRKTFNWLIIDKIL